jgi:hypothetical protein
VHGEVAEDDDDAGPQRGDEYLLDVRDPIPMRDSMRRRKGARRDSAIWAISRWTIDPASSCRRASRRPMAMASATRR